MVSFLVCYYTFLVLGDKNLCRSIMPMVVDNYRDRRVDFLLMLQSECAWRDNVCILRIAINFASGSVGLRSDMILLNDSLSL